MPHFDLALNLEPVTRPINFRGPASRMSRGYKHNLTALRLALPVMSLRWQVAPKSFSTTSPSLAIKGCMWRRPGARTKDQLRKPTPAEAVRIRPENVFFGSARVAFLPAPRGLQTLCLLHSSTAATNRRVVRSLTARRETNDFQSSNCTPAHKFSRLGPRFFVEPRQQKKLQRPKSVSSIVSWWATRRS